MRLLGTLLLIVLAGVVSAQDEKDTGAGGMQVTETPAGRFYSSPASLEAGFPFSDMALTQGGLLFLSGLVGTDVDGNLVSGGLDAETHAIFRQMKAHLAHLGLGFGDVVKCLVMIDDIGQWGAFNTIYTQYFSPPYPARSAMGADGLALGAALELECIAATR